MNHSRAQQSGSTAIPAVSVVMGVYNGGADLEPTLRSVLDQDFEGFEFIIIDDGSTDGSGAKLDQWAARDTRVQVEHRTNQGLTQALRRGCELAKGDYIARQDCGDRSFPGRLSRLAKALDGDQRLTLVASAYRHVGPAGELLESVGPRHSSEELRAILLAGDPETLYGPHHGTVMFRRDAYVRAGGYRPEFYFAQDLDLWTRLAAFGAIGFLEDELYEVKYAHGSITGTQRSRQHALKLLIAEATRLRGGGLSDASVLDRASQIRPDQSRPSSESEADVDYFLGSCLAARRDPAARRYLWRVLRRRPWMAKAWAKLLLSVVVR